jgi:hypothetical protein
MMCSPRGTAAEQDNRQMAEGQSEEHPQDSAVLDPENEATSEGPVQPKPRSRGAAPWFAILLLLVIIGIALAPFWAPTVVPLLPWGVRDEAASKSAAALSARVAALDQRSASQATDLDAVKSAQHAMTQRVDQLETAEKRPAAPAGDEAVKSTVDALVKRVDQLEAAGGEVDHRIESDVAAEKTGLQQIQQRLAALEAQSTSLRADNAAAVDNVRQELSRLSANGAELANRLSSLEHDVKAQSASQSNADARLALLLAQMREAVEQARPFQAEYEAFTHLAQDPALAAAAKPLGEAARKGVASRAVLARQLAELMEPPAAPREPDAEADLGARVLARLRGLITIRRIDGTAQTGLEAAVSAAQSALSHGDLAGAVAALDPLTGAEAEAVRPWLQMARERLAAETALDRLQERLTVRLGNPRVEPAAAPASGPQEQPGKPKAPS